MVIAFAAVVCLGLAVIGIVTGQDSEAPPSVGAVTDAGVDVEPAPGSGSAPSTQPTPVGVDVRTFGAVGDGVTDDAPAIREALARTDVVYVPAGTYLLGSYLSPRPSLLDADFVFQLRTGQSIVAAPGAVFRMGNGVIAGSRTAWGGNVFLADGVHDVAISGLTLDMNGANNLVPRGRVITGYGLYLNAVQGVRIDGVTMRDTPGQNYVVAQSGGAGIEVRDSVFHNGGTSLPGNTNQDDFSALYFTASDVTVDRVTIDHDQQPFNFSGGVELHGPRESVTNSRIHKSWPAVYIGPDSYSDLPLMQGTTVSHNEFLECGRGVVFNAGGTGDIDGVDISKNVFHLVGFAAFPSEPPRGVDQDMPSDGRWTYHHIITDLSIASNDFYLDDPKSDAVIRLSQVHSASIRANKVHDAPGGVLVLGSSPWGTTNVTFADNEVAWRAGASAPAIALAFDGTSVSPPRRAFEVSGISIRGNRIALPDRTARACAVYANWAPGAPVTAITVQGNELTNIGLTTCGPQAQQLVVE